MQGIPGQAVARATTLRSLRSRKETNVKHAKISLRRRHFIIAGLAGVAAPAGVFAGQSGHHAPPSAKSQAGDSTAGLVLSGRILGGDHKPLAGATVEAWQAGAATRCASTITDGDGRFMFSTITRAEYNDAPRPISYRVTHPAYRAVNTRLDVAAAPLQRDESGIWRAAVGFSLA